MGERPPTFISSDPSSHSIPPNTFRSGREAKARIDRWLAGEEALVVEVPGLIEELSLEDLEGKGRWTPRGVLSAFRQVVAVQGKGDDLMWRALEALSP